MASIGNTIYDAALDAFDVSDQIVATITEATTYGEATTDSGSGGKAAGESAISATDYAAPADGDTSGRKLTFNGKDIIIDVAGTVDFLAFVDDGATDLLATADLSASKAVSVSDILSIQAFDILEIADPA